MVYKKITAADSVSSYIFDQIASRLAMGKKVLWLMSGGSAIAINQTVLSKLQKISCSNLAIGLTDERFGKVGHTDENWTAILRSTPVPAGSTTAPINNGKNIEQTTMDYAAKLKQLLQWADYRIGFFGIGADGHTAGILPHSSAVKSLDVVASYQAHDYARVTMTPIAIEQLHTAVVYAVGEQKHAVIEKLGSDVSVDEMPSQILKQAGELVIFNDFKGDTE
jgi:6-phosphogluconolactonase/glucosamine-6-phosphate isomerase/deaminase